MMITSAQNCRNQLTKEELKEVTEKTLRSFSSLRRVLVIHPDYSRHDFSSTIVPILYDQLKEKGLEQLDTLNASGTHRAMSPQELKSKLGLDKAGHPLLGRVLNHEFDNPAQLKLVGEIDADFVRAKTAGQLNFPLAVNVNKTILENYDLIIAISGTVPHEATGFSGGNKIFFPGISGPEVTGLFHWAAVLIGIPQIIGSIDNPAREVVDYGTNLIFNTIANTPVVSLNMVYSEDPNHQIIAKGLFSGVGIDGFKTAFQAAASLSSKLHIIYLDQALKQVVQEMPDMYDEIWTAGKGSYKLQRPGVLADDAEIIIYAPHIHCFHSNKRMDNLIRQVGYHGRDYIVNFCRQNPDFDKNVAAHLINVRGLGSFAKNRESFSFRVTLATAISPRECQAVGLGYCDPKSLREEDFKQSDQLWIKEGGQWLYSATTPATES